MCGYELWFWNNASTRYFPNIFADTKLKKQVHKKSDATAFCFTEKNYKLSSFFGKKITEYVREIPVKKYSRYVGRPAYSRLGNINILRKTKDRIFSYPPLPVRNRKIFQSDPPPLLSYVICLCSLMRLIHQCGTWKQWHSHAFFMTYST